MNSKGYDIKMQRVIMSIFKILVDAIQCRQKEKRNEIRVERKILKRKGSEKQTGLQMESEVNC